MLAEAEHPPIEDLPPYEATNNGPVLTIAEQLDALREEFKEFMGRATSNAPSLQGQVALALARAQGEFPAIIKDKSYNVTDKHGNIRAIQYADLADVLNAVRPCLSRHGLAITQRTEPIEQLNKSTGRMEIDSNVRLITDVIHSSGAKLEPPSVQIVPRVPDAKEFAIYLGYYRKQQVTLRLGLAADTDSDGEIGDDKSHQAKAKREAAQAVPMPESDLNRHREEMAKATDNKALQKAYKAGIDVATQYKDHRAYQELVTALRKSPHYIKPEAKQGVLA
jgi:hypothetical protein